MLSRTGQVLQIQTPQAVSSNMLTLPTLAQDRPAPTVAATASAPPVVSVSFANPSSDEDVSAVHTVSRDTPPPSLQHQQRVHVIHSTAFNPLLGHMLLVALLGAAGQKMV